MITIVTDKSYIQTNKIHSIYMNEHYEDIFSNRKHKGGIIYIIHVNFEPINPLGAPNLSRNDVMSIEMRIFGLKRATLMFRDMIRQIREQCPDQLYLDKIAENFLTGEIEDDPSPDEICNPRKEKKRSKKVLRRAKRSGKRSSKRSRRKRVLSR
jgi:hypothetical protein